VKKLINTQLNVYKLHMDIPEEKAEYQKILQELKNNGVKFDSTLSMQYPYSIDQSGEVEIDFSCVFDNQFNTTNKSKNYPDMRLFDHTECMGHSENFKLGYYITMTDEIKTIRSNTFKCGYCGKQHTRKQAEKQKFYCNSCLDSEYLEEIELKLLKLTAIDKSIIHDKELPKRLFNRYIKAQTKRKAIREKQYFINKIDGVMDRYKITIKSAKIQKNGYLWLLKNKIKTSNCIYYEHTNTFCFGWRNGLSESVKNELERLLKDFPFKYEFK